MRYLLPNGVIIHQKAERSQQHSTSTCSHVASSDIPTYEAVLHSKYEIIIMLPGCQIIGTEIAKLSTVKGLAI